MTPLCGQCLTMPFWCSTTGRQCGRGRKRTVRLPSAFCGVLLYFLRTYFLRWKRVRERMSSGENIPQDMESRNSGFVFLLYGRGACSFRRFSQRQAGRRRRDRSVTRWRHNSIFLQGRSGMRYGLPAGTRRYKVKRRFPRRICIRHASRRSPISSENVPAGSMRRIPGMTLC